MGKGHRLAEEGVKNVPSPHLLFLFALTCTNLLEYAMLLPIVRLSMELCVRVRDLYGSPVGPLSHLEDLRSGEGAYSTLLQEELAFLELVQPARFWYSSRLNPANRVDNFQASLSYAWRVHCTASSGKRIVATPIFKSGVPPLRIDIYIPAQHDWALSLRSSLDAAASFHTRDARSSSLGINQYVASRLSAWSSQIVAFEAYYRDLPFATRIFMSQVIPDCHDINYEVKYSQLEGYLGLEELMGRWNLSADRRPEAISVRDLILQTQITEAVAVIGWPTLLNFGSMAMKSATENPGLLYHELRTLLTLPDHPHVMKSPRYLVTDIEASNASAKVVGFLQEYLPLGSLDQILPNQQQTSRIQPETRLKWAKQITSTLIYLRDTCNYFYSDLKTANIVVRDATGDLGDIVFIDFEQNGTSNVWSAPEVYHVETLELASRIVKDSSKRLQYQRLLMRLTGMERNLDCKTYCNPPHGHLSAWAPLTPTEKEAAQVFALGKVLFCIFESVGVVNNQIAQSSRQPSHPEFPHFVNTPSALRSLILRCTEGARELDSRGPGLLRDGDKLVGHCTDRTYKTELEETIVASRTYWLNRIQQMEEYAESQIRVREEHESRHDGGTGPSRWNRPTLRQVLDTLEAFDANVERKLLWV